MGSDEVGPARATFRLVEAPETVETAPDAGEPASTNWRVEFLLQSTTDPSLLIPAAQVWQDAGTLQRWVARPQELLLTDLGRASRVYPNLAFGLRMSRPEHLDLDAAGAYEFLTTAAPALDEAGFGVLVPNWWQLRRRIGLKLTAKTPSDAAEQKSRFSREQLYEFDWRLAVGDESLTDEESNLLAAAKAPLVRLRGQWVAIDPEQLRRGLEFLASEGRGRASAARILTLAAAHPDDNELPMEIAGIAADGWLGDLLAGTTAQQIDTITPPDSLHAQLRPYQQRGLSWLAFLSQVGLGACLADDMGLGKTLQLLALEVTERVEPAGPSLLLCPMSLVGNWQAEARKFAPTCVSTPTTGRNGCADLTDQLSRTDIVVTTYGTATRDLDELAEIDWNRWCWTRPRPSRTALPYRQAVGRLRGEHRVALTGTRWRTGCELWSIMDFLNPGCSARPRSSEPGTRSRSSGTPILPPQQVAAGDPAVPAAAREDDPTIIDDLPDKIEIKQYYRLTSEQASLYQSVADDMMAKIAAPMASSAAATCSPR